MSEITSGVEFESQELERQTKKNQSLFNIQSKYQYLMQEIEENEGEITEEQALQLQINENELQVKSLAYLEVIRKKESFVDLIESEIKRLQALKKQSDTLVLRLKDSLLNAVKTYGEFNVGTHSFGIRKSKQVIIDNEGDLPPSFCNTKITVTPDKKQIKDWLEKGNELEGCSIQENLNLKIK